MTKKQTIESVQFSDALGERYLAYAMSTIMSRSLPDVRDGLKPVHRRLLYAMLQLKLDPKHGFKKCARVVGDVIGKYHPHGDTAVYDAMVRLAQSFSLRYPLVEGQGNFGSIDGDNAAAMRYTEARLTEVALSVMANLQEDTVDFLPTYDGSEDEPVVMPSAFPNLLANGSEGIAVGMATSIPPHNASELCDALLQLIKHPNTKIEKLVEFVPGPDFPTGGVLVEPKENILKAYETGKGAFRIRAKWEKEELSHGQYQIIITEIPYQVQKSRLIEKIADLFKAKKLTLLSNIRDESAEDIRIVLEPKNRSVDPEILMASLFKCTDLETRFNMNLNVLTADAVPQVLNLREALQAFLDHRHEVLLRRSKFRLGNIDHRLEVLEGFIIAYLNLDEVIRIIREEDEPKPIMMKKWKLTDVQVEAILNMRLRSLRKLEEVEIRKEHDKLSKEKEELQLLLSDEGERWKKISSEIRETKKQFGKNTELGKRFTDFGELADDQNISFDAFIEKEPITVICSKKGWIRAVKGHGNDPKSFKYKEGDGEQFILKASTTDKLVIFGSNGRFYTVICDKLPRGKGFGDPVRLMVEMDNDTDVVSMFIHNENRQLLVASSIGKGFLIDEDDVIAQTRSGKQILNLPKGAKAVVCAPVDGDMLALIGSNRKMIVYKADQIPQMKRGQGVILQKYKQGTLSDAKFYKTEEGLTWKIGNKTRTETDLFAWLGKRGGSGKLPPVGFPRNNTFG